MEGNSEAILGKQAPGPRFAYLWGKPIKQSCYTVFPTKGMEQVQNTLK